jgi:hypothetical protein
MAAMDVDVRGYRWWRVGALGRLYSPWRGNVLWAPGFNDAECDARTAWHRLLRRPLHEQACPSEGCRCGFYGMYELPDAGLWAGSIWELQLASSGNGHHLVFGVTRAAGTVLLAEHGWRAARAEIIALYAGPDATVNIGRIAERYRVPVYRHIEPMAREWGPGDDVTLLLGQT